MTTVGSVAVRSISALAVGSMSGKEYGLRQRDME